MTMASTLPDGWIEITDYREALEVYRSPAMGANPGSETDEKQFRGGTVIRLDGPAHHARRRVMNQLLKRDGHAWFRETALHPAVRRNLDALLETRGPDGAVRTDLLPFGNRLNIELAAAVAGVDGAEDGETARTLLQINQVIALAASQTNLELLYGIPKDGFLEPALEARREFEEQFFDPSLARRQRLLEEVAAGRRAESDLPQDVMTLIAAHADPNWIEDGVAVREILLVMRAVVSSSTQAMLWTVEDLKAWTAEHAEDEALLTDDAFLNGAVNDSLRFHPANPGFIRVALENVTLTTGRRLERGQMVAIRAEEAARDRTLFGADADRFNPRRQVGPGVYPYGLAFASGRHMCFGLPLVIGNRGMDGMLVYTLKALYRAGMRPDPERRSTLVEGLAQERFESYPVIFATAS
ncbi:MAG TPA: cytochrome P450 [Solirubrobacteraceae bacterium]|jgi:cytochrome P450